MGSVTLTGDVTATSTGAVTIDTERNIVMSSGSSLSVVDGDLTLSANQQATTTTGDFRGFEGVDATLTTTGTGNILIEATGGDAADNEGIFLQNTDVLSTSSGATAGTITLDGISHSTSGEGAAIRFRNGSLVESIDGDIAIDGISDLFQGVFFLSLGGGTVRSTGTGANAANINITGESLSNRSGFQIDPGTITSVDGDIAMTGISNGGNGFLVDAGSITSTGTGSEAGKITLTGTSTTGIGASFQQAFQVQSVDGDVTVVGTGGNGVSARATTSIGTTGTGVDAGTVTMIGTGTSTDLYFDGTGSRLTTSAGDIQLQANTVSLNAGIEGSGALQIIPRTAATSIGLGGGAGTLNLDNAELALLADGFNSITIGDANGFLASQTFVDSGQSLGTKRSDDILLGDLDGDGDLDAFAVNRNGFGHTIWLNDGTGVFDGYCPKPWNQQQF